MFEALETGKFLDSGEFSRQSKQLRLELLQEQLVLAGGGKPVVLVVAGPAGAGKGRLAHRLTTWMDPRHIDTHPYWRRSDEERARPWLWRYWRRLPENGHMGIFLGSWYSRLLNWTLHDPARDNHFEPSLDQIVAFEQLLRDDGYAIVKLWLHVSRERQLQQLTEQAPREQQNPRTGADPLAAWDNYPRFLDYARRALERTDTPGAPWTLIAAKDHAWREVRAGETLLEALKTHNRGGKAPRGAAPALAGAAAKPRLNAVNLGLKLGRNRYRKALRGQQERLQDLAWQAHRSRRSLVAVFEGWDAAGKGSTIRRVTEAIDPRLYHLVQIGAPVDEALRHHYLWRFWRELQADGRATLFDRSWYGRVLVERVEGLASPGEWQRAYAEINAFERQLSDHGIALAKFWLHLSADEQLRRFRKRENKPHKRYKITADDWRNRAQRPAYTEAVESMLAHTDTVHAPWTLVASEDKRYARVQVLRTLGDRLEAALAEP